MISGKCFMNLRPMSIADILDLSLELLFKKIWLFTGLSLFVQCPTFFVGYFLLKFIGFSMIQSRSLESMATGVFMIIPLILLISVIFSLSKGILIAMSSSLFVRRHLSLPAILEFAIGRIVSLSALAIILCLLFFIIYAGPAFFTIYAFLEGRTSLNPLLIVIFLWLLALISSTWLIVKLFFALPAVIIENRGAISALRRSWELSEHHWWKTWALWNLTRAVILISGLPLFWYMPVVGIFYYFVIFPLATSSDTVLFYDILIRREAFDLFLWAEGESCYSPKMDSDAGTGVVKA
jgi:hypothetical protein